MNTEIYQALMGLEEIFNDAFLEGEKIVCYKLIKEIVNGEISKQDISENERALAQRQLNLSMEWLQCIGVTIQYQDEFVKIIG